MVDDEDDHSEALKSQMQSLADSTLLPSSIANTISLVTRSSALSLRLGTFIAGLALDGARVTTLTGLELSRALIEGILSRAGRDVAFRSSGDLGRVDAEGLLERSIYTLHSTITYISFAASTGFYISSASLSSASDLSQQLLTSLDSILGSTDSSRAIASIITLIRREFENPATGMPGEKVGMTDLLVGICGLALLQRWCKNLPDIMAKEKQYEEVVWDVVILDDGRRADVIGSMKENHDGSLSPQQPPFISASGKEDIIQNIQRGAGLYGERDEWPETDLKDRLMQSLPPDASVSIRTETTTTKTITVEIMGAHPSDLSPPPGVEIIEENAHHTGDINLDGENLTNEEKIALLIPRYRVVYRTVKSKLRGTGITAGGAEVPMGEKVPEQKVVDVSAISETIPSVERSRREASEVIEGSRNVLYSPPSFSVSPLSSPGAEEHTGMDNPFVDHLDMDKYKDPVEDTTSQSTIPIAQSSNQKGTRNPTSTSSSVSGSENYLPRKAPSARSSLTKKSKPEIAPKKSADKKGSIRNALRKGSGNTLSNLWNKEPSQESPAPRAPPPRPPWGVNKASPVAKASSAIPPLPPRVSSIISARDPPRAPQRGNPNNFSTRDLELMKPKELPRSPSRASYYEIHERRRDSMVSQTDTYSIHSADARPGSPTTLRTHLRAQSSLHRSRAEKNVTRNVPSSPSKSHRKSNSYVPSIYTLKTNNSETSLILSSRPGESAYQDLESLETLMRTGHIDGLFPQHHIVRNITRFIRFASASYGSSFMRIMGITSTSGASVPGIDQDHHYEHHSFSNHTQLPPSAILLSSFVDPQGGTDATGRTNTGVPMVHYVSLDHDSRAVVLTCRGTLGFEDVLTDMTCEFDDMSLRGKTYKVHKGIHASAVRLLSGNGSRVIATLAAALEEFPDYGLVMCGHSLGGGVTALLAIMISEPSPDPNNTAFVTASASQYPHSPLLLTSSTSQASTASPAPLIIPPGRPIHVYAYGPPSTISPPLRLATLGLITTIVNGQDLVPYLSLGTLHDLQAVALAFKSDDTGAKREVRARVWASLTRGFANSWYGVPNCDPGIEQVEDQWALSALKVLRASMQSEKLVPPGEVFVVDTMRVLQREAFTRDSSGLGRPAVRAVLRHVRDVEGRFGELNFGGGMLLDHSPGRYESSLAALGRGVLGTE